MTLLRILLIMCLIVPTMQPLEPMVSNIVNTYTSDMQPSNTDNTLDSNNTTLDENDTSEAGLDDTQQENSAAASDFTQLDLEGYCTISVPMSHFTLDAATSNTNKKLIYKDNKTRVTMSYVTNMSSDTDFAGYISRVEAGVDTLTNNQTEEVYNNITWTKIVADPQEDWCTTYVWYTLNDSKTSALWVRADVQTGKDDDIFFDVMAQMFNTYHLYVTDGTLFKTPTTGIYKHREKDDTVANTSEYKANNEDNNTVFKSHGGYVLGAKISDNWDSMEIILDGTKFQLPCSFSTFEKAGFEINDKGIEDKSDLLIPSKDSLAVQIQNKHGTVIKVICANDSAVKAKSATKCQVQGLVLDYSQFVNVKTNPLDETYNKKTAKSDMASKNAKDGFDHELVLPSGITWGVYIDDLKNCYGNCLSEGFDSSITQHTWKSGNKQLIIRTGAINQIKYIKMTCSDDRE